MPEKTVKELKDNKKAIESNILNGVQYVEREFGCTVTSVDLVQSSGMRGQTRTLSVKLNIEID